MIQRLLIGAAALTLCYSAAGCATSGGAGSDIARLEADNRRLRGELGEKNAAAQQAHAAASQAETQAGVAGASCSQVAAQGAAPRSGAQHGKVELNGAFFLRPKFAGGRAGGPVQVIAASCEVGR